MFSQVIGVNQRRKIFPLITLPNLYNVLMDISEYVEITLGQIVTTLGVDVEDKW